MLSLYLHSIQRQNRYNDNLTGTKPSLNRWQLFRNYARLLYQYFKKHMFWRCWNHHLQCYMGKCSPKRCLFFISVLHKLIAHVCFYSFIHLFINLLIYLLLLLFFFLFRFFFSSRTLKFHTDISVCALMGLSLL